MDELYSKSPGFVRDEKFNDLLSLFKSKTKNVSNEQIDHLYEYSLQKSLSPLTLLVLKLRLKFIKKLPMNQWDKWIGLTSDFLAGTCIESSKALKTQFFKVSYNFAELCCEIGLNYQDYLKKAYYTLLEIMNALNITQEITPIHSSICKIALMTKNLSHIEHLINYEYLEVNRSTGITGAQCVTFFYYIGSAALILKHYGRASYYYNLAISVPAKIIHAATLESYKKQVLLHLIIDGSEYHVPRSAPRGFNSIIRHQSCEPYSKLALLFADYLKGRFPKESVSNFIIKYKQIWASDKNSGLIKKVIMALIKHKIKKLTKVYASLSFKQLKSETEEESALEILGKMIEDEEINGKIDEKNETVLFFDKEQAVDVTEIHDVCEDFLKYSGYIESRLNNVSLDPRYLKELISNENISN